MRQVTTSPCIPVPLTSGYLWEPRQRTVARYQGFEINIIKYNKLETCGYLKSWLGRQGSNLRMAASKAAALPLGDAPASQ